MTPSTPTADDNSYGKMPNTDDTSPRLFECNQIIVEIDGDTDDNSEDLLNLLENVGRHPATDETRNDSNNWESLKILIRNQHPLLLKEVSSILFESDPMCLNFDNNVDEYDPEAVSIISELSEAQSPEDVADIVIVQFRNWFDCDLSPYKDNDKFTRMSKRIWLAWCERQNQQSP
jgi:hypothetical protein